MLEINHRRPDGSTYIVRIYRPRIIREHNSDMSFLFNIFLRRFKKNLLNILMKLKIINLQD